MTTNKFISNFLGFWSIPEEPVDSIKLISYIISDGFALKLVKLYNVKDMSCLVCQGDKGFVCMHEGEYAWMCSDKNCLESSSCISKEHDRKAWLKKINQIQKRR